MHGSEIIVHNAFLVTIKLCAHNSQSSLVYFDCAPKLSTLVEGVPDVDERLGFAGFIFHLLAD